jgi:hypothetical protein
MRAYCVAYPLSAAGRVRFQIDRAIAESRHHRLPDNSAAASRVRSHGLPLDGCPLYGLGCMLTDLGHGLTMVRVLGPAPVCTGVGPFLIPSSAAQRGDIAR